MLKFIPFRADHLEMFDWQAGQAFETRFKTPAFVRELERGYGWTGVDVDMNVVGCAGLAPARFGVAAWAAFSPLLPAHARQVVRFVRQILVLRPEPYVRTYIDRQNGKARRLAGAVGFELEASPGSDDPDLARFDLYRLARSSV